MAAPAQCYHYYDPPGSQNFSPPSLDLDMCSPDAQWLYKISLHPSSVDSPMPPSLQIYVDQSDALQPVLRWGKMPMFEWNQAELAFGAFTF